MFENDSKNEWFGLRIHSSCDYNREPGKMPWGRQEQSNRYRQQQQPTGRRELRTATQYANSYKTKIQVSTKDLPSWLNWSGLKQLVEWTDNFFAYTTPFL